MGACDEFCVLIARPLAICARAGGFITHFVRCGYFAFAQYDRIQAFVQFSMDFTSCYALVTHFCYAKTATLVPPRLDFVKSRNNENSRIKIYKNTKFHKKFTLFKNGFCGLFVFLQKAQNDKKCKNFTKFTPKIYKKPKI